MIDWDSFWLGTAIGAAVMCAIWVIASKYAERG